MAGVTICYAISTLPHMSQVIIVSNRLPVSVKKVDGHLSFNRTIGGLAGGLSSYVKNRKNIWIGWPGIASDELNEDEKQRVVVELAKYHYVPVFLTRRQIDEFYNGYSNTVIWPLFHNLAAWEKDHQKIERWWRTYQRVNELYQRTIVEACAPGSRIWVHDYQLMLVPDMVRKVRADVITGFFLHIPFPSRQVLTRIKHHKQVMKGMLGADVVGLHTPSYVANFLEGGVASGLAVANGSELVIDDRGVSVSDFPMGIDYEKYSSATRSKDVTKAVRYYRKRYKRRKLIVSVDRLDPSKGLIERLTAYHTLLNRNPKLKGKIIFAMVAAPSRTDIPAYRQLSERLSALANEINTEFGTANWQPVDYMNNGKPFEDVTALFRIADVAFIAPLRDGMNLAAKEFVASKRKPGVLILSQTAGAADELQDALLVDPQQPESLVEALEVGLKMRKRELRRRLKRMKLQLSTNTVHGWAQDFVATLQKPIPGTPALRTLTIKGKLERGLLDDYSHAKKRLLLLDYDGSLVPFTENYQQAKPPQSLLTLLDVLGSNTNNAVVLISGRSADDLENWFGDLPINLVAEHGAARKAPGAKSWRTLEEVDNQWKQILKPILEKYAGLAVGARLEIKPHSLVWHYRGVSPYYAQKYTVIIKRILKPHLKSHGLELLQGNKILEIKNPLVSKGTAADRWLSRNYDFVLALGDDMTDEELFAALPPDAYGIKIGRGRTLAPYRLASYKQTRALLKKLV